MGTKRPPSGTKTELTGDPAKRSDNFYLDTERARRLSRELRTAEGVRGRDYDGVEAALVELGSWRFGHPRKGYGKSYGEGVTRAQAHDAHRALYEALLEFARDADARDEFMDEGESAAEVNHPSVLPLLETGESGSKVFAIHLWPAGRSLAEVAADGDLVSIDNQQQEPTWAVLVAEVPVVRDAVILMVTEFQVQLILVAVAEQQEPLHTQVVLAVQVM